MAKFGSAGFELGPVWHSLPVNCFCFIRQFGLVRSNLGPGWAAIFFVQKNQVKFGLARCRPNLIRLPELPPLDSHFPSKKIERKIKEIISKYFLWFF